MGKFHQFLTALSARNMSEFFFLDDNLSNYQWIFTKPDMCIDIVEIWFGIADGQILSIFDRVICLPHDSGRVLSFHVFIVICCDSKSGVLTTQPPKCFKLLMGNFDNCFSFTVMML